ITSESRLVPGQPLSEEALRTARTRLSSMGLFRRIGTQVEPLISGETEARVIISVSELPRTTLDVLAGLTGERHVRTGVNGQENRLELSPRGSIDIGRRGLGGRNRSVNLFSRAS